jgi:hypothetical protein
MILSAIFEFSSYATMSQSFFATVAHPFFNFVMPCQPFCNLSVILGILSVIFLILLNILEISLSHSYNLLSHFISSLTYRQSLFHGKLQLL